MCRVYTHHSKVSILKQDEELLWKDQPPQGNCDSLRTLETSSSFSVSEHDIPAKSCLKFITQEESLFHTTSTTCKKNKSVDFSAVDIHVHALRLGDNPSITSAGPPLTISWKCERSISFDLEEYQKLREEEGIRRREELRVPDITRMEWLDQEGIYSFGEMMKEQAKAIRLGNQRRESAKECVAMEEKKEQVKRKFQKWILLQKSHNHLYLEWKKQEEQDKKSTSSAYPSKSCHFVLSRK